MLSLPLEPALELYTCNAMPYGTSEWLWTLICIHRVCLYTARSHPIRPGTCRVVYSSPPEEEKEAKSREVEW